MKINGVTSYVITGLTLAIVAFMGYTMLERQLYLSAPVSSIFEASVIVPDFQEDKVPEVQYERAIHQAFVGAYTVEVKEAETGRSVCIGHGEGLTYDRDEPVPTNTDLDWYIGGACTHSLMPGQYYLETNYTISEEGMPNRYLTTKSNVFNVKPK